MDQQINRRTAIQKVGLGLAATSASGPLWWTESIAQANYPSGRVVTIITPFGSSVDMFARFVAEHLTKRLGGSFIVEQKLGAGGTIATNFVSKQKPDGYTLGIGVNSPLSIAPHLYKNIGYSPQDLTYLAALMSAQSVLIVTPAIKSLRDLVELSKKRSLNYGSPGVGSGMHLGVERFNAAAGITNAVHVAFKTTETLTTALIAGDVDYYMSVTSASSALIKSGRLAALAVTGRTRSPELPTVPTFAEIGLNSLDIPNFYGLVAPPGLPKDIAERLITALKSIAADPDFRSEVTRTGNLPILLVGRDFKDAALADSARQAALIKKLGIEPQ